MDDDDRQQCLFLRAARPRRKRTLEETHPVLDQYIKAYTRVRGEACVLGGSFAEAARHAKRLGELLPDHDLREAFLAAFLSDRSPFLARECFPLRLALRDFPRYRRLAEWAVLERRRIAGATPAPMAASPAEGRRRFGRSWTIEGRSADGAIVLTRPCSAPTREQAEALATAWWLRDAPYGVHHVVVAEGR